METEAYRSSHSHTLIHSESGLDLEPVQYETCIWNYWAS